MHIIRPNFEAILQAQHMVAMASMNNGGDYNVAMEVRQQVQLERIKPSRGWEFVDYRKPWLIEHS